MKIANIIILFLSINVIAQTNDTRINKLRSETKIDSNDKEVFNLLQEYNIQLLQSEEGQLTDYLTTKLEKLHKSKKTKNRHLLVMFMAYQFYVRKAASGDNSANSKIQLDILNDLESECKSIFNKVPAIVYIYKVEALGANSQSQELLATLNDGLRQYPKSIPLKVYKYLSTQDIDLKNDLISNHSNHWMVRQFDIR